MDPVDVLEFATDAARMIRSSAAPEVLLEEACRLVGVPLGEPGDSLAVQVTRLVEESGEKRQDLYEFLRARRGTLYLNRHNEGWGTSPGAVEGDVYEPDSEIPELLASLNSDQVRGRRANLLRQGPWPFAVGRREIVHYIEGELEGGGFVDLPDTARALIDYPLEKPVLFEFKTGREGWYLWDVLTAFADQYARIYQQPERFGVWGHDLSDLWIELLYYYPDLRLIYPTVGS
jgi:hypothetical protein